MFAADFDGTSGVRCIGKINRPLEWLSLSHNVYDKPRAIGQRRGNRLKITEKLNAYATHGPTDYDRLVQVIYPSFTWKQESEILCNSIKQWVSKNRMHTTMECECGHLTRYALPFAEEHFLCSISHG